MVTSLFRGSVISLSEYKKLPFKPMPPELAVRIEDLSITYKINVDTKKTLKNAVMRASKGEKVRMRTVEAVKHMNLEIPHGSVLGLSLIHI